MEDRPDRIFRSRVKSSFSYGMDLQFPRHKKHDFQGKATQNMYCKLCIKVLDETKKSQRHVPRISCLVSHCWPIWLHRLCRRFWSFLSCLVAKPLGLHDQDFWVSIDAVAYSMSMNLCICRLRWINFGILFLWCCASNTHETPFRMFVSSQLGCRSWIHQPCPNAKLPLQLLVLEEV